MNSNKSQLYTCTDIELVELYAKSSNMECVAVLFSRYSTFVYSVCLKYIPDRDECKDASMQVFEKLFIDLKKHTISNFKSWLHTVAKNHCLMQLRKKKGVNEIGGDSAELLTRSMEYKQYIHLENENDLEIKLNELESAIQELGNEQRICIELFYLQEKSYLEIANSTGFSLNNVKSYIQNGKRNLKNIIISKNVEL